MRSFLSNRATPRLRVVWFVAALALGSGCSAGVGSGTSGSGASSTGGHPDAGACSTNSCHQASDCCPGYGCNTVLQSDSCCLLPSAAKLNIPCLLDSDCCAIPTDAGSELPMCSHGVCIPAPNCAPLFNPCTEQACCPSASGPVICNPVNQLCTLQGATVTGGATTGGPATTGTSGTSGGASSSGTTGGSSTGGSQTSYVFSWTFGINQACEQAGAAWVEIQLSGATIGLFPCRDPSGTEGATIPAASLAQSDYTLTAYSGSGSVALAQAAGTTPVAQGLTSVPIDFGFDSGGPSNLNLSWTFGGASCAEAGVSQVQITLTDPSNSALDVNESVACSASGHDGLTLSGYGAGQFPLSLSAAGSDGGYQATASLSSNGLSDSRLQVDLQPSSTASSGDVHVQFNFGGQGCLAAGLDSVGLQLSTSRGAALAPPIVLRCDAGSDYLFSSVPAPASAFLWVEGIAGGEVQQLANPQVVVSPGATASYSVVTQLGN